MHKQIDYVNCLIHMQAAFCTGQRLNPNLCMLMQGLPVWMEHLAALDVPGMEGAGVTVDDYCFYQVRVGNASRHALAHARLPISKASAAACSWC